MFTNKITRQESQQPDMWVSGKCIQAVSKKKKKKPLLLLEWFWQCGGECWNFEEAAKKMYIY